jgi:hypothetical protein
MRLVKIFFTGLITISICTSAKAQFNKNQKTISSDTASLHHPNWQSKKINSAKYSVSLGYGVIFFGAVTQFNLQNNTTAPSITGPIYLKNSVKLNSSTDFSLNIAYASAKRSEILHSYTSGLNSTYLHKYSTASVIARFNFYFPQNTSRIVSPYWGFGFGWASRKNTYDNGTTTTTSLGKRSRSNPMSNFSNLPIAAEFTIGTKIKIYDLLYGYVEVGVAKSLLQTGLQYRF